MVAESFGIGKKYEGYVERIIFKVRNDMNDFMSITNETN